MAGQTVDYIVRVRGATDASVDQAVAKLKQFVNAQEDVAVSAEKVSRAQLSAEKSLERWSRSLDMNFRQMREMEKLQKDLVAARQQGLITDDQAAVRVAQLTDRHMAASRAQKSLADTTKLTRYEMINLSRQVQDVTVGLASGQSPFTVLVQQGTQIADVFAASQTTVRQFFTQALGWAGRFATSTAGVVTGVTAIGASALLAAQHWSSGQIEIDRALTGVGKTAGITRTEINALAETSAESSAISVNEARKAAVTFASTGEIYSDNIKQATGLTKDFARATGTDAATAAKTMAAALAEPSKGAIELNKQLRFLDAGTLDLIESLEAQNKKQEAQKVLLDAMTSSVREQAKNVDILTRVYEASINAISKWLDLYGKAAARGIQQTAQAAGAVVGPSLGGMSQEEELANARQKLQERQQSVFQGPLAKVGLANAIEEVGRLEAEFTRLGVRMEEARFAKLSLEAKDFTESLIPQIKAIEQIEKGLAKIRDARSSSLRQDPITGAPVQGGPSLAHEKELDTVDKTGRERIAALKDAQAAQARQVELASKLRETNKDVSLDTLKTLEAQKSQLSVAQAITGTQKLNAEEAARIAQLVAGGAREEEAAAIAAGDRAIKQTEISSAAARTIIELERQLPVVSATTESARMDAQERAKIAELLDHNVGLEQAIKIAADERALKQAAITAETQKTITALERQLPISQAITVAQQMDAQERAKVAELVDRSVRAEDAARQAALERANAQAQINAQAEQQLQSLREQEGIAAAVTVQERLMAQEVANVSQLIRQGVDAQLAMEIAAQQTANAEAEIAASARRTLLAAQDNLAIAQATTSEEKIMAEEVARINQLRQQGVELAQAEAIAVTETLAKEEQLNQQATRAAESQAKAQEDKNMSARDNLAALRDQFAVASAVTEEDRAAAQHAATYNRLVRQGVDSSIAAATAAQEWANAMAAVEAAAERTAAAAERARKEISLFKPIEFEGTRTSGTPAQFQKIEAIIKAEQERGVNVRPGARRGGLGGPIQPIFEETSESIRGVINDILRGGGGLGEAIRRVGELPTENLPEELRNQTMLDLLRRLTDISGSPQQEIEAINRELARARSQPQSLEQLDLIKTLNDRLKQLTDSTDSLNDTLKIGLDPIYTEGHQALKIGYYDERGGGMRTGTEWTSPTTSSGQRLPGIGPATTMPTQPPPAAPPPYLPPRPIGPNPGWGLPYEEMLRRYREGGGTVPVGAGVMRFDYGGITRSGLSGTVTNMPSLFSTSENYHAEAIIPLQNGAVPVVMRGGGGNNISTFSSSTNVVNVMVAGGTSIGDRRTRRQIAQGVGRAVAGAM